MVIPALGYLALNAGGSGASGWGIPMATDIAFALGILALLGRRLPPVARVFLLALAIVDDVGAILVIAVFYTHSLAFDALGVALGLLGAIVVMQRVGVVNIPVYLLLGVLCWVAVLKSGIHATIAGVVLGMLTPLRPQVSSATFADTAAALLHRFREALGQDDRDTTAALLGEMEELTQETETPLERLERLVHPWSSYGIMPVFALANAGLMLSGEMAREALASPVTLGVVGGLLVGKPVGVVGGVWLAVRLRLADLPASIRWLHIVGLGFLAGIGFTMSLFLTGLAFTDAAHMAPAKLGVFVASVLAGLAGYTLLRLTTRGEARVTTDGAHES